MLGVLSQSLKSNIDFQNNKLWFLLRKKINIKKSGKAFVENTQKFLLQGFEKQELDEQIMDVEQKR